MPVPEKQTPLQEHVRELPEELAKLIVTISDMTVPLQNEFPHRLMGVQNAPNKYGEVVAELDNWANGFICDRLIKTGLVRKIYSEELESPLIYNESAPFVATLDPLDGSSNIISNNAFGTIVGVYREDLPQTGRKLVAAFYKLYGPVNTFVYTVGSGTHEFVKHYDSDGSYPRNATHPTEVELMDPAEVFPELRKRNYKEIIKTVTGISIILISALAGTSQVFLINVMREYGISPLEQMFFL